jgi:hypothetical protein
MPESKNVEPSKRFETRRNRRRDAGETFPSSEVLPAASASAFAFAERAFRAEEADARREGATEAPIDERDERAAAEAETRLRLAPAEPEARPFGCSDSSSKRTRRPPRVAGGAEEGAPRAPPTVFARQGSGVPNSACARIARHRPHPFAAWRHFGHPSFGSGPLHSGFFLAARFAGVFDFVGVFFAAGFGAAATRADARRTRLAG